MELIVLIVVAVILVNLWPYLFPKRCRHGVPIRANQPNPCSQCEADKRRLEEEARLKEEEAKLIEAEVKRNTDQLRRQETENIRQLTYLQRMDPLEFERVVSQAYRNLGWQVQNTPASGDRGVDAYLRKDGKTVILQCKRISSGRVGTPVLRDLLGTVAAERADEGILATTSFFSEEAIAWAHDSGRIELIDGHKLLQLIDSAYPLGSLVPEDFITRRKHPLVVPSRCPWCGAKTKRRKGAYGSFYGCSAFPTCRWTMPASGRGQRLVRH